MSLSQFNFLKQFNQISNFTQNIFIKKLNKKSIDVNNVILYVDKKTQQLYKDKQYDFLKELDQKQIDKIDYVQDFDYFTRQCIENNSFITNNEVRGNVIYNLINSQQNLYFILENICRLQTKKYIQVICSFDNEFIEDKLKLYGKHTEFINDDKIKLKLFIEILNEMSQFFDYQIYPQLHQQYESKNFLILTLKYNKNQFNELNKDNNKYCYLTSCINCKSLYYITKEISKTQIQCQKCENEQQFIMNGKIYNKYLTSSGLINNLVGNYWEQLQQNEIFKEHVQEQEEYRERKT